VEGQFGSPRAGGGTLWKGVFIAAQNGEGVKAVAGGRVVFADWLRGFGNLMIIDHGGAYMTLYANNEALYKRVGDPVRGGETIATVGNSGGNPDSGLYFELRHEGKALDPLSWVDVR
jgi:septal ring factor EnvC (AmiA/AmiB activator)